MSRRALVIQHEEPTPPGLIAPWLRDRGYEVETLRIDEQDPHDLDPRAYELIVSLGSEFGAYQDDIEWIKHEMDFLAEAQEAEVPILGVCFGGQILARVLGGDVFRSEQEEIGWLPVGTSDPDLVSGRSVVSVAFRHVHCAPWRNRRGGKRGRATGLRHRPQPRCPVPSGGDDGDHG